MIVSTSIKPPEADVAKAKELAAELDARYVPRRSESLAGMRRKRGENRLLIVSSEGLKYYEDDAPAFYYHPSMAFVRVKRLRRGESDPLIDQSGCEPGDRVLDCTAGLCADALVFSYAVGEQGSVTALESEPLLHAIVREGLAAYKTRLPDVDAALRRIRAERIHHLDKLAGLPDDSFDIVYFDPMFRRPLHDSSALEPLRSVANPEALSEEAVRHAVRVARKSVMLKEHKMSGEFERLGFRRLQPNKTSTTTYGVISH